MLQTCSRTFLLSERSYTYTPTLFKLNDSKTRNDDGARRCWNPPWYGGDEKSWWYPPNPREQRCARDGLVAYSLAFLSRSARKFLIHRLPPCFHERFSNEYIIIEADVENLLQNWSRFWKLSSAINQGTFVILSVMTALSIAPLTPIYIAEWNRTLSDIALLVGLQLKYYDFNFLGAKSQSWLHIDRWCSNCFRLRKFYHRPSSRYMGSASCYVDVRCHCHWLQHLASNGDVL